MLKLKITGYADSTVRAYYDLFLVEGATPLDEVVTASRSGSRMAW